MKITLTVYDDQHYEEQNVADLAECFPGSVTGRVRWIDVAGARDAEMLRQAGECQGLHHLVLEDLVNNRQRPKIDDYGDYLYVVLKMLRPRQGGGIAAEQLSIVLGTNLVISFRSGENGDLFSPVRERLMNGKGRIRIFGADYLLYTLIDAVIDNYFVILEGVGERINALEEKVVLEPRTETVREIQRLKRETILLRRSVWPLREVLAALERRETKLITEPVAVYMRDLHDHTIQVIDTIETSRDMLSGMLDIYLTSINNRMNEIMKFLTVIGTIFMPLTFIAGVYGMNFQNMPELHLKWGYYGVLVFMVVIAVSMLFYFRRKKWL